MRFFLICIFLSLAGLSCIEENKNFQEDMRQSGLINRSFKELSDVIVHDIFSPPVASRIYAYPAISAYEIIRQENSDYPSLLGKLNGLEAIPKTDPDKTYSMSLAAIQAFLVVAKNLIFSEDKIEAYQANLYKELEKVHVPKKVWDNSLEYGIAVAETVIAWANKDNYKETRSFPKFSINEEQARWKPTPPAYMESIEPHWNKIRPMVINSADQFSPPPPTAFSLDKNSKFHKELMEVYNVVKNADKEEKAIASFWDCNPYVMNQTGHVMFATKKITPGGHWIGITGIACNKAKADIVQTSYAYAMVSIALMDAFISCWDEKYRSNLIRPETVINEYIDESWLPTLQTPPFPEHTSGHSVISTASANVLTKIFGDNFSFDDDVELEYGLPIRSFDSFQDASDEAAISRLYGGIHYRPAIDYGVDQGNKIGQFIINKIGIKALK
jgi:hypothetical protein